MPRNKFPKGHKLGLVHGDAQNKDSPHESWKRMRQRCLNPNYQPAYKRYGGRGIRICPEWEDYTNFRDWALSHGWEKGLCLDRVDVDGDYCPTNCRWVTKQYNTWRRWHSD